MCGCGEDVVGGEVVAASETCEREAVEGESAQRDSDDWDVLARAVVLFPGDAFCLCSPSASGRRGC